MQKPVTWSAVEDMPLELGLNGDWSVSIKRRGEAFGFGRVGRGLNELMLEPDPCLYSIWLR